MVSVFALLEAKIRHTPRSKRKIPDQKKMVKKYGFLPPSQFVVASCTSFLILNFERLWSRLLNLRKVGTVLHIQDVGAGIKIA